MSKAKEKATLEYRTSKEVIIDRVANYLGLPVVSSEPGNPGQKSYNVMAPSGVILGYINIFESGTEGWKVGGASALVPFDWDTLINL